MAAMMPSSASQEAPKLRRQAREAAALAQRLEAQAADARLAGERSTAANQRRRALEATQRAARLNARAAEIEQSQKGEPK